MLVDLGRNDLGRNSQLGSVQVEKYMSIEALFPCHAHRLPPLSGLIRPDRDARMPWTPILRGHPLRRPQAPGLPDHPRSWRGSSGASMAAPWATWTLPESGHLHRHPPGY
jgi:hypothetical protein